MSLPTFVKILCEDKQHEVFVRKFFLNKGIPRQKIRANISPSGRGAGCKYVLDNFLKELDWYRKNANRVKCCLIIVIDSDVLPVHESRALFDQALKNANEPLIESKERVSFIIPRRNIETWIKFLLDETVDETTNYPHFEEESSCFPAIERISPECQIPCNTLISSLKDGKNEIEKVFA